MTPKDERLILDYLHERLEPAQVPELNELLRQDPEAREFLLMESALDERLRECAEAAVLGADRDLPVKVGWGHPKNLMSAAAGLVVGLFGASLLQAVNSPAAHEVRSVALGNAGFEASGGPIPKGFPKGPGYWSGDESEAVTAPAVAAGLHGRVLRFDRAQDDPSDRDSKANFCDVFQVIDLRYLKSAVPAGARAHLEVTVEFLDSRPAGSVPVEAFFTLSLFSGNTESLAAAWPETVSRALKSATAIDVSTGSTTPRWWESIVRCEWSPAADFALIHLAAGKGRGSALEAPDLRAIFADNVRVQLKVEREAR